ncbi:LysM peptidoglycan-binding domain-containing protein [Nocardioides sp. LS1]|uniref:LysM peptidoglycan-binding domain-containing protein n=1 Tax=Nocardioides sp. LS1 TaxID=1027620 RepID=UPI000F61F8EE|nr:LysM peptidoglycan-binding domain-containing protein [Nocardioides sp. LS1]GCD91631.1 hypothetical protein NLS1_36370 [Nocardioides sp. LS1]
MNHHPARPTRCATVWLLATTAAAGLVALLLPLALPMAGAASHGDLAGRPFDDLLVGLCAAVAVPATCWLWAITTLATLEAARGVSHAVPRGVRRVVLVACGVALTGGLTTTAALADTPQAPPQDLRASAIVARVVNGLPLPDRATATTAVAGHPVRRAERVTVHRGDTLWGIAARDLAPGASDADINTHWQAIYAANRGVIGADPGLIHPDQQLRLPRA